MPWCPKCKTEYREGFSICAECGSSLVDKLPQKDDEIDDNGYYNYDEKIQPICLTTVQNRIQSNIIQDILSDADIPSYFKDREAGTYLNVYMGHSIYGVDIFVDKSNYKKAKELVNAYYSQKEVNTYKPLNDKDNRSFYIRKKITQTTIILCVLIPLILFFIFNTLIYLIN